MADWVQVGDFVVSCTNLRVLPYFSCKWWDQRTKKYNPNGVRAKLAVSEARRNRAYNKLTYWYYLSESGEVVEVMLLLEQMNKESRPSLSPMRAITTSEDEFGWLLTPPCANHSRQA